MSARVEVKNLARRFGAVEAVRGVSFAVAGGEVFGLVGPDGAGKTTTLRMMAGLVDADAGEARVEGSLGYMAQRFGLYGDLSVEENMDFYADLYGIVGSEREDLKDKLLAMTRMGPFRKRAAAKLSGGMKQKLSLMCTLLHQPQVLLLDEPTNGVDPLSRRDFWQILEELVREGLTVVATTAYLDEAERCHRVALMHEGRLIAVDTPDGLKSALPEECYAVRGVKLRETKEELEARAGVRSVTMSGAELHVLVEAGTRLEAYGVAAERIRPSLEDVLIAEIGRRA